MPVASPLVAALLAATSQRVPTAACTSPRARGVVTSRSSLSSGPFEELRAAVTAVLDDRKSAWASLTLRAEEIAGLPFRTAGDGQLEARRLADSLQQDAQRFAAEAARLATLPRKRLESRKVVVDTSAIAAMMMAEARALAMLPARKASEAQAETRGLAVEAASKAMRLTVEAQRLAELSGHKAAEAQALAAEARREAKRLASLPYKRAAEAQVEARRFVLEAQASHSSTPLLFLPLLLTAPEASFLPRGCRSSHSCSQDTIAKPGFVHQCMPVFLTQAGSIHLTLHPMYSASSSLPIISLHGLRGPHYLLSHFASGGGTTAREGDGSIHLAACANGFRCAGMLIAAQRRTSSLFTHPLPVFHYL